MSIAQTILGQIKTLDAWAMDAWGAKDLIKTSTDGLQFKSSGMVKWKGIVNVELDQGSDTYTVKFLKIRKMEVKTVNEISDVYAMDLVNVIEAQVG